MSLFEQLKAWRDDRVTLAHAKQHREELWHTYKVKERDRKLGLASRADAALTLHRTIGEIELLEAEVSAIETKRIISRAILWDVPVTPPPLDGEEDTPDWRWHPVHGVHYLSQEGKARIRRDTYLEMDMRSRPFISWAAVGISIVSLIVAVLKP